MCLLLEHFYERVYVIPSCRRITVETVKFYMDMGLWVSIVMPLFYRWVCTTNHLVLWSGFPPTALTHWGQVTHICVSKLIIIDSDNGLSNHYLNKCWNIVNWAFWNLLQWHLNRNSYIFIWEKCIWNVKWPPSGLSLYMSNINLAKYWLSMATLSLQSFLNSMQSTAALQLCFVQYSKMARHLKWDFVK